MAASHFTTAAPSLVRGLPVQIGCSKEQVCSPWLASRQRTPQHPCCAALPGLSCAASASLLPVACMFSRCPFPAYAQHSSSAVYLHMHSLPPHPPAGASQPHKHMQIVPLPLDDDGGSSDGSLAGSFGEERAQPPVWPAVAAATEGAPAGQPVELRNLPFAAFAARLAPPDAAQDGLQEPLLAGAAAGAPAAAGSDSDGAAAAGRVAGAAAVPAATGQYLEQVYCRLLASCKAFVEGKTGVPAASPQDGTLSYNMGERWGPGRSLLQRGGQQGNATMDVHRHVSPRVAPWLAAAAMPMQVTRSATCSGGWRAAMLGSCELAGRQPWHPVPLPRACHSCAVQPVSAPPWAPPPTHLTPLPPPPQCAHETS